MKTPHIYSIRFPEIELTKGEKRFLRKKFIPKFIGANFHSRITFRGEESDCSAFLCLALKGYSKRMGILGFIFTSKVIMKIQYALSPEIRLQDRLPFGGPFPDLRVRKDQVFLRLIWLKMMTQEWEDSFDFTFNNFGDSARRYCSTLFDEAESRREILPSEF